MNNKMVDLHNHLFCQLERLSDEDTTGDKLKEEVKRAQAISGVARNLISNGFLILKAEIALNERELVHFPALMGMKEAKVKQISEK